MNLLEVLKKPVITEKTYKLMEQQKYVFVVYPKAGKKDIKLAFENIFNTKVQNVNIIKIKSKPKKVGRFLGKKPGFKKAVITLFADQKLNLFDEVETEKESVFTKFKKQFTDLKTKVAKKDVNIENHDEKN